MSSLEATQIPKSPLTSKKISKVQTEFTTFGLIKETALLIAFGMVLPTLDVYFDVALIYQFANEGNPIFAGALSIPVIIFALFLLPHWWKTEKNLCQRIKTFPLLILHLWPQSRVAKLIRILWRDPEKYAYDKAKFDRDITCLGKFLRTVLAV